MKLIFKVSIAIAFLFIGNIHASAQADGEAERILKQVSDKYDAYKTIQANFEFLVELPESDTHTDKGTLYLDKPHNSYRIKLSNQEVISDGKSVWSILPEDEEVQITDPMENDEAIGPNNIFTFYKKGYKYVRMEDEFSKGKRLKVIELAPENTQQNYFKIKLRINENSHIHDVKIFDKSGARYTYSITNLYVNHTINRGHFSFQKEKYKNFEIVDLR